MAGHKNQLSTRRIARLLKHGLFDPLGWIRSEDPLPITLFLIDERDARH